MINIEPAKKADAAEIVSLLCYISNLHKKGRPDIFVSGLPKYDEEQVKELIDKPGTFVISAKDEAKVCGYMIAYINEGKESAHIRKIKTLYIDDICVSKDCGRKGIGTMLFEEAKRICKAEGCEKIELNVWAFNDNAVKFYKKLGMSVSKMNMEFIL